LIHKVVCLITALFGTLNLLDRKISLAPSTVYLLLFTEARDHSAKNHYYSEEYK
jgi:hypothetical protein